MKRTQALTIRFGAAILASTVMLGAAMAQQVPAPPGTAPTPPGSNPAVPAGAPVTPPAAPPATAKADAAAEANPFAPPPGELPPGMTGSNANDPRSTLKAGLFDAGEAASGMEHIGFAKKPTQFRLEASDPSDPAVSKALTTLGISDPSKMPVGMNLVLAQLVFANSDMAFQGAHMFVGNFSGISIYDISDPAKLSLVTTLVCPGGQGDVSVYGKLLFMSDEMPNGRVDCGGQGFPPEPPPAAGHENERHTPAANADRFRGVRIFDISDIGNPKQVAAVQTCRGSHTHTLVVDPNDKDNVYIYVSGTSFVRPAEELAGCSGGTADKDPNTALFRIDVIQVPLSHPQDAKVVSSPRVFMDARSGAVNGLNNGGSHGKDHEKPADTNQCHDITVYSAIGLAAGACSGNGILLDIHDPIHPKRVDAVNDPNYSYWHSASFNNDGTKVVFTDEWGGGLQPRCRTTDPNKWGADSIFNLKDDKLTQTGYYKMPAAQTDTENCVAHNGSLVPVPGRDIEVQAWYQGGVSIMDFTDAAHPFEIAYFDRGPLDAKQLILGGDWSAYWYNGNIYGSEITRGVDVFKLVPGKFLTQNEIDAARLVHVNELNVQNQQRTVWPADLIVAKAYLDQLDRAKAMPETMLHTLREDIERTEQSHMDAKDIARLKTASRNVEAQAKAAKDPADAKRMEELAKILASPAAA